MNNTKTNLHRTKDKKTELEVLEIKRHRTKNKEEEEQQLENESAKLKDKEHKLIHEHKKRRKEGEEKTHEDGGMVG